MATIDFKLILTDEAMTYAREASINPGWYLTPHKWAISSTMGELAVTRTTDSMFTPWITQPFSGIYPTGTNKLLHSVVIPPNAYKTEINIGEIYFIYKDYYGNEFLYAIGQPTGALSFNPGVAQKYSFIFTVNNTTVPDIVEIDYTYPQDIEDHNQAPDVHPHLLARDGSRTAEAPLYYSQKFNFNDKQQLVDKEYVDTRTENSTFSRNIGETVFSSIPIDDANLHLYDGAVLVGTGVYTEFVTYMKGIYNSGKYPKLFVTEAEWQNSVSTYGVCGKFVFNAANNSVRLPKITGLIEGTIDVNALGSLVTAGLPNLAGTFSGHNSTDGKLFTHSGKYWHGNRNDNGQKTTISFDASRYNPIYGKSSTVQPQTIKQFVYMVVSRGSTQKISLEYDKIINDLNNKADTDLSNVEDISKIFKKNVLSWIAPNYNASVEISSGYTTPSLGYLNVKFNAPGDKTTRKIYVNGVEVGVHYYYKYGDTTRHQFMVDAGDVITFDKDVSVIYYPNKGGI